MNNRGRGRGDGQHRGRGGGHHRGVGRGRGNYVARGMPAYHAAPRPPQHHRFPVPFRYILVGIGEQVKKDVLRYFQMLNDICNNL